MPNFTDELLKGYAYLLENPGDQEIPLSNGQGPQNPTSPSTQPPPAMPTLPQNVPQKEEEEKTTPEGEVMLIDLIRKGIAIDPKNLTLTMQDKSILAQHVTPKNGLKVLEVLKRIIDNYELPDIH